MERWQKACFAALGALLLILASFSVGYRIGDDDSGFRVFGSSKPSGSEIISDAYDKIRSGAVDPPSEDELAHGAVKGMVEALKKSEDPYAFFYTARGYKQFQNYTSGQFSGIGVWLKDKGGRVEIVSVLPSTPALEVGLRRGDVITRIDERSAEGLTTDEAVTYIKGPVGSKVELQIERGGDTMTFEIVRANIDLPNLVVRRPQPDLGYIRLFGFARGAGAQLREEVDGFVKEGVDGIVLDLRDNGGGLFSEAIKVSSVFLKSGEVVTYKERSEPDVVYEAEGRSFDIPIVVLVNEGTASASEIVAGALQDRDRAILVGATTFGKGSVQEVFPLADASALKFTTGAYETPNGRDINGEGIEPDVEVAAQPSVQRRRAVEILKGVVISTTGTQG